MLYVNDGTEFSIGGKRSGVVIRYKGKIRGVMVLIRDREFSYMNYEQLKSIKWNKIIRIPCKTVRW